MNELISRLNLIRVNLASLIAAMCKGGDPVTAAALLVRIREILSRNPLTEIPIEFRPMIVRKGDVIRMGGTFLFHDLEDAEDVISRLNR